MLKKPNDFKQQGAHKRALSDAENAGALTAFRHQHLGKLVSLIVGGILAGLYAYAKLLTDNLLALNRDIGELTGASHTHTSG